MIVLPIIACLLLASCSADVTSGRRDKILTNSYFDEKGTVIYSSSHDIIKISIPFNQYNIEGDIQQRKIKPIKIFFIEGDVEDGKVKEKGLYVFKNGTATKLLDNGKDTAATSENVVYFGASDGIYKYNEAENEAEKYGTITDNIIQLAHSNKTNAIYYLTDKHELYKLSEDAKSSVKLPFEDVQAVVFDFVDNMYYYDSNKNVYVVNSGVGSVPQKVEGLPSDLNDLLLIPSMHVAPVNEVYLLVGYGREIYRLKSDATASRNPIKFEAQISAAATQLTFVQYYGRDKKICKIDLTKA